MGDTSEISSSCVETKLEKSADDCWCCSMCAFKAVFVKASNCFKSNTDWMDNIGKVCLTRVRLSYTTLVVLVSDFFFNLELVGDLLVVAVAVVGLTTPTVETTEFGMTE